jgi:hypothetical protein
VTARALIGTLAPIERARGARRTTRVHAQAPIGRHELVAQLGVLLHVLVEDIGAAGAPLGNLIGRQPWTFMPFCSANA